MSATNRGAVRADADYYPTPAWCARRILEALAFPPARLYLEPCAGDGALVRALKAYDPTCGVVACELRPAEHPSLVRSGADVVFIGDALSGKLPVVDVAFMNPPFSLAVEFVRAALDAAPIVVALERLTWACTWGKAEPARMPSMFVLPNRPSFTGAGRTDASEYAWFVWGMGPPCVRMLPSTPLQERKFGSCAGI